MAQDPQDDPYASTRDTSTRFIRFETSQGVSRITLNRVPGNVLSVEMMDEIGAALDALEYEKEVKLVVLAAEGKYFSAGFELGDHQGDRAYLMLEAFHRIFEGLSRLDKPTLSVIAGAAFGAGSILAAACDIALAGASARFGHPEIKGGVFNPLAAALLPRLVGRKKAMELILLGGALTAAEAERIGLVSRVVPDDKLEAEAAALVQRFQEGSAPVLQLARRAVAGGLDLLLPDAARHAEDVYLNQLLGTEDVVEGLQAVMAKRKPVWKDK
jgi:cyclohexa-1,5-dienecarbonyl-CoA hydratase